jgi:hypothetical protein
VTRVIRVTSGSTGDVAPDQEAPMTSTSLIRGAHTSGAHRVIVSTIYMVAAG